MVGHFQRYFEKKAAHKIILSSTVPSSSATREAHKGDLDSLAVGGL